MSNGKTVLHSNEDGARLMASRWMCGSGVILGTENGSLVDVSTDEFPALIAALYEAAGLGTPVVLERPELHEYTHACGISLRREGSRIFVAVPDEASLEPGTARRLAAYLAAYADQADAEPDPAQVEELTVLLGEAYDGADGGHAGHAAAVREQARAILRAGYRREADGANARGKSDPRISGRPAS